MPDLYVAGAFNPPDFQSSTVVPIYGVAQHAFINRNPMFTRLPQAPLGSMSFKTSTSLFRPQTTTISNSGSNVASGATTIPVADASIFQTGDTFEVLVSGTYEEIKVTGINLSTNVLTVTRAYAGTTAQTIPDTTTVQLISNARTGGEINVTGISQLPGLFQQWSQTFQYPVHVAGALNACTDLALPPGVQNMIGRERLMAIQNCADDAERQVYYGRPVSMVNNGDTPKFAGFRSYLRTNNNYFSGTNVTNYTAYMPSDFVRDLIEAPATNGGAPDAILVPTNFMTVLATWGIPQLRVEQNATAFGVKMEMFQASFLGDIMLIPCPLLRKGNFISLTSSEVRMRVKRNMFYKPRGSTGDADQADVIFDGALEVDVENHHAMVTGVTGYAKQS